MEAPSPALTRLVKRADRVAAYIEATRLAGFSDSEADRIFGRPAALAAILGEIVALVEPWPTGLAQERYLARFADLADGRADLSRRPTPEP